MTQHPINIQGMRLAAVNVGIKQTERPDFCLIEAPSGSTCAAVFTQNRFAAAPVAVAKKHLQESANPRYLLINSGNANCGTGAAGIADAEALCSSVALQADCNSDQVLPFSTGVIGERLPTGKMTAKVGQLFDSLSADGWMSCAKAIMTTDTRPKTVSANFMIDGQQYSITGIAKGAGMIKPNMATMLSFLATDAGIEKAALQHALQFAVADSFNRITIDGDTSTNDAVVIFATGSLDRARLGTNHAEWDVFATTLAKVCTELAKAIVADGEGATKFVEVKVKSPSVAMSEAIGFTVAESPLVKTALFASDPNWGRILAAIGRAPVEAFDIADVAIFLGEYQIVAGGSVIDGYQESMAASVMANPEIKITIEIGDAAHECSIWTTDLSYDYVRINAEYRS